VANLDVGRMLEIVVALAYIWTVDELAVFENQSCLASPVAMG
jgi:hypothetical protein